MLQSNEHIGKLDRQVTFIQSVITDGDSNEDKITGWEEIDSFPQVWAKRKEAAGSELVINDRINSIQKTVWTIRYRSDLTNLMRLVFGTQVYEIIGITEANQGRKRYLDVTTNLLDNEFFT